MADRASAMITLGGRLPAEALPDLLAAIEADGGFGGWDEHPIDDAYCRSGEPLEICGYELAGGVFSSIEQFAAEHGLAFVRSSGSCAGAFGPERVVFDGLNPRRDYDLTEYDMVVLGVDQLRRLGTIEAAEAWFAAAEFAPPALEIVDAPLTAVPLETGSSPRANASLMK